MRFATAWLNVRAAPMIDPDEYLDDPKMRKFGRLSRQMQREWREERDTTEDKYPRQRQDDDDRQPA